MPEVEKRKYKAIAKKKGMSGKEADMYATKKAYGGMKKKGKLPSSNKRSKMMKQVKRKGLSQNYSS